MAGTIPHVVEPTQVAPKIPTYSSGMHSIWKALQYSFSESYREAALEDVAFGRESVSKEPLTIEQLHNRFCYDPVGIGGSYRSMLYGLPDPFAPHLNNTCSIPRRSLARLYLSPMV